LVPLNLFPDNDATPMDMPPVAARQIRLIVGNTLYTRLKYYGPINKTIRFIP